MPSLQSQRRPASAPQRERRAEVLIVDDSIVARSVIGRLVDGNPRCRVAGSVPDADSALAFLRANRVDLVLLDVELPGRSGLAALPDLIAESGGAKVLVVSSSCEDGAASTVQALALGAADTLVKPSAGTLAGRFSDELDERLTRLLEPVPGGPQLVRAAAPVAGAMAFDAVAIGASTGGIHALGQVLRALPATMTAPILVTQHLPESFMPYFAAQLALLAGRPCDVGDDRMRIRKSRIIVAPGHAHLRVVRTTDGAAIRLSTQPAESGCVPSVDPMFESVAEVYGRSALGVVLSGMGRDGAQGAARIAGAGGRVVVQDRESSTVWGMPGAVATAGCASAVLRPDAIGALIARGVA